MKKKNVLVTGIKGFVGSEIVRFLEKEYEQVFTVENRKNRQNEENRRQSDKAFAADITNKEDVLNLKKIGGVDFLVHSAGLAHQFGGTSREDFQNVNVKGTANILELARKLDVAHFILISSVSVYGQTKDKRVSEAEKRFKKKSKEFSASDSGRKPENANEKAENRIGFFEGVEENAVCSPKDFYAESKLDGENIARSFCSENNIRLTILRLATVVGEEDKGNFLNLIRAIDRRFFVWIGKGENHKSLVHREDVARACIAVLGVEKIEKNECEIFNVSAKSLPMRRIVEIVAGKLGKTIPKIFLPAALFKPIFQLNSVLLNVGKIKRVERTIGKWLADDVYSAEKIKRVYGFETQISAEKAVEREVEWYIATISGK